LYRASIGLRPPWKSLNSLSSLKRSVSPVPTSKRRTLPGVLLLLGLWLLFRSLFVTNHHYCPGKGLRTVYESENITKVPFEAHIMSKCPDAKDCLGTLVVESMSQVSDKVDFTLSYIGRSVISAPSFALDTHNLLGLIRKVMKYPACTVLASA
jgi:hypothetical protein